MPTAKIKVLCVDDSALIRSLMTEIINSQPDMQVVATASDPLVARDLVKQHNPDVMTLDVEMPRMDGLEFLEKLMRLRPMPVVMVSSLTRQGSEAALRALELGAIDFVAKPSLGIREGLLAYTELITDKIRAAACARLPAQRRPPPSRHPGLDPGSIPSPSPTWTPGQARGDGERSRSDDDTPLLRRPLLSTEKLIIIGASTGGTEAIREVLEPLPPDCPGILIAQHMPPGFTHSFAQRLHGLCRISVKEAVHGERVLPGHAYIAPGGFHLSLARSGANYVTQVDQAPPVNRHRPSIDVLFDSAALHAGKNAMGVILTGMGRDGAEGLLRMRQAGAWTLAQDEASCVVFGMPREAILLGAAADVSPLADISQRLLTHLRSFGERSNRV